MRRPFLRQKAISNPSAFGPENITRYGLEIKMKIKGIHINTEMVPLVLDGRKTRASFPIKLQPNLNIPLGFCTDSADKGNIDKFGFGSSEMGGNNLYVKPQYRKGDILFVQETWGWASITDGNDDNLGVYGHPVYKADVGTEREMDSRLVYPEKWISSTQMPYKAARIFLHVTGVEVQLIQGITEQDAIKEGARDFPKPSDRHAGWDDRWIKGFCSDCRYFDLSTGLRKCYFKCETDKPEFRTSHGCNSGFALRSDEEFEPARFRFAHWWDMCDKTYLYHWASNPWVWAYYFERITKEEAEKALSGLSDSSMKRSYPILNHIY
jgi:hypothetical protein